MPDDTGGGNGSDAGNRTSRHTFTANVPARRSTLSVLSARAAGLGGRANAPTRRSSVGTVDRLREGGHLRENDL